MIKYSWLLYQSFNRQVFNVLYSIFTDRSLSHFLVESMAIIAGNKRNDWQLITWVKDVLDSAV